MEFRSGVEKSKFDVRRSKFGVRTPRGFTWNRLLWALVHPRRRQQIMPTISGVLLIGLSFGIGTAAYNAANNILFITLSLLLACLILSGVLSWLNFRRIEWRLEIAAPLRAGRDAVATLHVRNAKKFLPTYGLWFELSARGVERGPAAKVESTFTAKGIDVRAAFGRAGRTERRERLYLRTRLDASAETRMEWTFKPRERGVLRVELEGVGSLFPFGFLKKQIAADLSKEAIVWAAPVEYRRFATAAARRPTGGERVARAGSGSDLLALRRYETGDSHRLIHWKASARLGRMLVRQFAAESREGFSVWVRTGAATWTRPEQFERLVGFAGTIAEDLFRAGNLLAVALDSEPPAAIRRVRDVEAFLDRLALLAFPAGDGAAGAGLAGGRRNLITFAPDGPHGVAAWVDGEKIAST